MTAATEKSDKIKLLQKMHQLQKHLTEFEKDAKGFNFKYAKGGTILKEARPKMDELGLMCIPSFVGESKVERYETINKNGEPVQNFTVSGQMRFIWFDVDTGYELSFPYDYFGDSNDPSQALGSALTYNERYNFLKSFHINTDADDPDGRTKTTYQKPAQTSTNQVKPAQASNDQALKIRGEYIHTMTNMTTLEWTAKDCTSEKHRKAAMARIAELGKQSQPAPIGISPNLPPNGEEVKESDFDFGA